MLCIHRLKWKHELWGRGQINISWLHTQCLACRYNCCSLYSLLLPQESDCLFMNSSVCCRQFGDEDIYNMLRHGQVCAVINLLSNLPPVLCVHPSILSSHLSAYKMVYHDNQQLHFIWCLWKVFADWHKQHCWTERALLWKRRWGVAENNNYQISNIHLNK